MAIGHRITHRSGVLRTALAVAASGALLVMTAGIVTAHNAVATCGGFLQLDYPSKTADIIRTSDDPDTLVYDNVNGGGKYAVIPGTYKVVWSDGYSKSNLLVEACPTPKPTPTPTPTPTQTPTLPPPPAPPNPTPTPTATPTEAVYTPTPTASATSEAATGTPKVTPPPTDSGVTGSGPGAGFGVILFAIAAVITIIAAVPSRRRVTRR
jgi:hypothetical protein